MPLTKVKLSGSEFGETYHIGAAMLLTTQIPSTDISYGWKITYEEDRSGGKAALTNAQQTFLNAIFCSPTYRGQTFVDNGSDSLGKADCTEQIIAPAFRNNPETAQISIRKVFLEEALLSFDAAKGPMFSQVDYFIRTACSAIVEPCARAIIRIRNKASQDRNITQNLVTQIANCLSNAKIQDIIFVGDALELPQPPPNVTFYDFRNYLTIPAFIALSGSGSPEAGEDFSFTAQLMFYHVLMANFGVKMQIGMMSGAMDGCAFIGIPTIFFEEQTAAAGAPPSRMGQAAAAIPWMKQVTFANGSYDSTDKKKKQQMPPSTINALDTAIVAIKKLWKLK